MIPHMVGKLAPNSSHLTRGVVKYVLGRRGYFRVVSPQKGTNLSHPPHPPQSLNGSYVVPHSMISNLLVRYKLLLPLPLPPRARCSEQQTTREKMKSPSAGAILGAAVLILPAVPCAMEKEREVGTSRLLQDAPTVGIGFTTSTATSADASISSSIEDELVEALESDEQVTGKRRIKKKV